MSLWSGCHVFLFTAPDRKRNLVRMKVGLHTATFANPLVIVNIIDFFVPLLLSSHLLTHSGCCIVSRISVLCTEDALLPPHLQFFFRLGLVFSLCQPWTKTHNTIQTKPPDPNPATAQPIPRPRTRPRPRPS